MDEVIYDKQEQAIILTINRPQRRNSITSHVVNLLRASLARANQDSDVKIIILTGAGDTVFCTGGDLGREAAEAGIMPRYDSNRELIELFNDIRMLQKPLLARVNGHALGAGFAIMLACDMAVAVENIRMGCPEMKVGQFPMMVLAHLIPHLGPKKAMELVLMARQISAIDAEQLGLINYAVARDELDNKVAEIVSQVNEFSPAAIRLGRDAFFATAEMGFHDTLNYLLTQLTLNLQTEDAKEGTRAFLQKRKPEWKGR